MGIQKFMRHRWKLVGAELCQTKYGENKANITHNLLLFESKSGRRKVKIVSSRKDVAKRHHFYHMVLLWKKYEMQFEKIPSYYDILSGKKPSKNVI